LSAGSRWQRFRGSSSYFRRSASRTFATCCAPALYGGFDREPFGDESREYVFVARRPPHDSTRGENRKK